jgi:predicted enzyme related to lactoylglutathione lyase
MEVESYEHGVPSWVDHSSAEPARAREFYAALFGWVAPEGPPEFGGYSVATKDGKTVAGIGPIMGPPMPAVWASYVNVDSADEVAVKVGAAGGSEVVAAMDVMDQGRMAVFAGPAGAVFGVWQPGTHHGAQLVNEVSAFGWSELITDDVEGAKSFYKAVFGWDADSYDMGGGMGYTEWKLNGRSIGGMMARPPGMPAQAPPFWGVYFMVPGTDAAVAKLQELGGSLMMGPRDIPQGRIAVVADPLGAVFNLMAMNASA